MTVTADDDAVPISAIEHYSYCPRQCGLIHVEQVFDDNVFTLRGAAAHERADTVSWECADGARLERALPVWSDAVGLIGRADVVEFRADGTVYPVEYKHGPRRQRIHDDLQLCAQAVCLEEMLGRRVESGAVYHISTRRRREVLLTEPLRSAMLTCVAAVRAMLRTGELPAPVADARCRNCSLADACVPEVLAQARLDWHVRDLYEVNDEEGP
ncbi:MAG: CRISPR-associated protein Cas4 [Chthonomonadales bacterium]|nr:CRISPR-associated protein Cas4 [Chthonomonadales bacterium]